MKSAADGFVGTMVEKVDVPGVGWVPLTDALSLLGWHITEGYVKRRQRKSQRPASVVITQSPTANPVNYAEIMALISRLGQTARPYGSDGKDIHIHNAELATWLADECGEGSYNKRLPLWVKDLPKEHLLHLLAVMVRGDGWISGRSFGYRSFSTHLIDDVQEIAIKAGLGANVSPDGTTVMLRTVQTAPTVNAAPQRVPYKGFVYCVSVPNQVILVRRNGKAIWTGNSYRLQKAVEQLPPDDKPHIMLFGHWHVAGHVPGYRNVEAFQVPCFESQTSYIARKQLSPIVGGILFEAEYSERGLEDLTTKWVLYRTTIPEDY